MINDIFQCINPNTKFFITDPSYSTLLVEVIHLLASQEEGSLDEGAASNTQMLKELLNNIYSTINIDYQNNYDDLNTTLLGEKTSHFVLNRLIKSLVKEEDMSEKMNGNVIEIIQEFLNNLWTVICNNLEGYLNTKCIFVIVSLIEAAKKIKNEHKFLNDLKKYQNLIKNKAGDKSMIAFGILNKIIS
jgi:hypothetical protein